MDLDAFNEKFAKVMAELKKMKYEIELLEKELEEYKELCDKTNLVPMEKLVKYRIERLVSRLRYSSWDKLRGIIIRFNVPPEGLNREEITDILNFLVNYIDSHIRPYDFLFRINKNTIGIIVVNKDGNEAQRALERIEGFLPNINFRLPNKKKLPVTQSIREVTFTKDTNVDEVFKSIKNLE